MGTQRDARFPRDVVVDAVGLPYGESKNQCFILRRIQGGLQRRFWHGLQPASRLQKCAYTQSRLSHTEKVAN